MSEIERLTARVAEFSAKADFWNNGVLIFLVVTALAAAGIVICQRLAFVRAGQMALAQSDLDAAKEHEAKTERDRVRTELSTAETKAREADARIAEAQRGSAEANARVMKAQESLALAEQHLAEANAKAEGFRLDIARANERAASANETAERERLARLQLEARLAPRSLSRSQQDAIRARLTPHGPRALDILVYGDTSEIVTIAQQVIAAFPAGWNIRAWSVLPGGMAISGFVLTTRLGSEQAVEAAANAIVASLQLNGVGAIRGPQFTTTGLPGALNGPRWDENNVASIRMLVGSKP